MQVLVAGSWDPVHALSIAPRRMAASVIVFAIGRCVPDRLLSIHTVPVIPSTVGLMAVNQLAALRIENGAGCLGSTIRVPEVRCSANARTGSSGSLRRSYAFIP